MSTTTKAVLYLIIGNGPTLTQWLVLTYDTSMRGISILGWMLAVQSAITLKAFYTNDEDALKKLIAEASANTHAETRRAEAVQK